MVAIGLGSLPYSHEGQQSVREYMQPSAHHELSCRPIEGPCAVSTSSPRDALTRCLPEPRRQEQALLERIADGDESALAELYRAHAPAVLALARRMLRSDADAEDLLHDVFVEAWRSAAVVSLGEARHGEVFPW